MDTKVYIGLVESLKDKDFKDYHVLNKARNTDFYRLFEVKSQLNQSLVDGNLKKKI